MENLKNKIAIVTGAGSRIGRAVAVLYASEGAKVVVVDKDPEGAAETVSKIHDAGGAAYFVRADIS